jgi:pyridoxal phosphate enzyme (YggS family)
MINANIRQVTDRMQEVCRRTGRNADEITLVAVTKTVSVDRIAEAYAGGIRDFGENRVQELLQKKDRLPEDIRWHLVGHLQTNKVKYIADSIHLIHSVDGIRLAEEVERQAARLELPPIGRTRQIDILIEVNTSGEPSKFGVKPEQAIDLIKRIAELSHVRIQGLMTVGAFIPNPEDVRPCFTRLRQLRDTVEHQNIAGVSMHHLSMGMTNDFEVAIEEGSTMVRIGTAIFGARH